MKFLLDEDVPRQLLKTLRAAGHDVSEVERSTLDHVNAERAKAEGRVLITLDKDFTNTATYPPSQFSIVHIQIHPPYANDLINAFTRLLATLPEKKFRGLIILQKLGSIRIFE